MLAKTMPVMANAVQRRSAKNTATSWLTCGKGYWKGSGSLPSSSTFSCPYHSIGFTRLLQQVVIINACKFGVDALVFGATQLIVNVPLPNIDLEGLAELSSEVLLCRQGVATEETWWSGPLLCMACTSPIFL
jgi:hypothetical protein